MSELIEVDDRRRISLAKYGRKTDRFYIVEESENGEIRLVPGVVMTKAEFDYLAARSRAPEVQP